MNCTAFGLLVAVPALIFFAVLQSKTHHLVDEIDSGAVRLYNVIVDVKEGFARPTDPSLA
jgi:biopolymer transport protein ExbB/TolQ